MHLHIDKQTYHLEMFPNTHTNGKFMKISLVDYFSNEKKKNVKKELIRKMIK